MSSATKDLSRLKLSGLTKSAPEPIVLKAPTNALTSRLFVALLHWRTVSQWCVMLYRHLSNVMRVHYVVKNLQYGSWQGSITQWPFRQFAVSCSMTNCWLETFRLHVNYNTAPSSNVLDTQPAPSRFGSCCVGAFLHGVCQCSVCILWQYNRGLISVSASAYEKPLRRNSASFIGPKVRHESQMFFFLSKRGDRSLAVWQSGKFCWFC